MTRYLGYIAMSLDGLIADAKGGVQWLDPFNEALAGDTGYAEFIAPIDALIMGRTTYEQVIGWGWPYEARAGYVLTHRSDYSGDHVTAAGSIDALRTAIEENGHKHVWVMGGGETQRAAIDAGMLHTLRVFIMPILLGTGLPCFAPGPQHNLTFTGATQLPGGIMQLDYEIKD